METLNDTNSQGNSRLLWVDACKGLCLFFVVIGHLWYSAVPSVVNTFIYSFHVPLYFVLSGYVLNTKGKKKGDFIRQKALSLLAPAFIYILITLPLYIRRSGVSWKLVTSLLYVNGKVPYNDPCWFFLTLFEVMCVASLLDISSRTTTEKTIIGISSLVLGAIFYYIDFDYFGITKLWIAFGFVALGTVLRDIDKKVVVRNKKNIYIVTGILLIIWIVSSLANGKISIYYVTLHNYLLFLIAAVSGCLVVIILTKFFISRYRPANYFARVGNNTMIIVGTHYPIVRIIRRIGEWISISGTWIFTFAALIATPVIITCYLPVSEWITKHWPILNGKLKI